MFLEGLETLAIPIWVYKCWLLCIDMRVFLLFYFSQKEAYHTLNIFLSLIGDLSRVQVHEQQLSEVWERLWEFAARILQVLESVKVSQDGILNTLLRSHSR